MRLVFSAPYRSNIQSLYIELGWQNLHERRHQHTLIMMYKILNNHTPDYLRSLIPPLVGNTMKYQLQNQSNIQVPTFRVKWHQNSFFPVGIKLWNALDDSFKHVSTLSSFKPLLIKRNISVATKQLKLRKKLFCIGDRYWNVIHSRMRMSCSLTHNLHVIENSTCECGLSAENNSHFLLECRLYTQYRQSMFNKLQVLPTITTDFLLHGDYNLTFEQNKVVFEAAQEFLKESGRF